MECALLLNCGIHLTPADRSQNMEEQYAALATLRWVSLQVVVLLMVVILAVLSLPLKVPAGGGG